MTEETEERLCPDCGRPSPYGERCADCQEDQTLDPTSKNYD